MALDQEVSRTLAIFSNYDCIRQGTLSQVGLKYSDEFTSQVSSKRERHKLGERERRSNLALALQELETTVAQTKSSAASQSKNMSKTQTVSAAIALIKELRRNVLELEGQLRREELCQKELCQKELCQKELRQG
jgi:Helix-loop-helix DNA-binding domain